MGPLSVAERLTSVRQQIAQAARASGRSPDEITLVAVSKRHDQAAIRAAYAAGQRDFGENYIQEWQRKASDLADLTDLRWHFVGRLQRNKLRHLSDRMHLLHAMDGARALTELSRRAADAGAPQAMLLQVNLSGEATKGGCSEEEAAGLVRTALGLPGLQLRGLMTMPPPSTDPEQVRPFFRRLTGLRERLRDEWAGERRGELLPCLSMGMTDDFRVAIAEGATHVRVGTAIFGTRPAAPVWA